MFWGTVLKHLETWLWFLSDYFPWQSINCYIRRLMDGCQIWINKLNKQIPLPLSDLYRCESVRDSYHLLLSESIWMTALRSTSCVFFDGLIPNKFSPDGIVSWQMNFHLMLLYLLLQYWSHERIRCLVHFVCHVFIFKWFFMEFLRLKVHLFIGPYNLSSTVF